MSMRRNSSAIPGTPSSIGGRSSAYSDDGYSDADTTEYGGSTYAPSTSLDTSMAPSPLKVGDRDSDDQHAPARDLGVPTLSLGALPAIRTETPRLEGAAEAEAAAEEAHRRALLAERKLAASEWAALRTPRAPPQRDLDILDVVYDREESQFQEWVPSSTFFKDYVRLLYFAANPLRSHPVAQFEPGEVSDDDTAQSQPAVESRKSEDYKPQPEEPPPVAPVTPRTRAKRFKALFKRKDKTAPAAPPGAEGQEHIEDQSKGFNFFSRSRSTKRLAQEQMEAAAVAESPRTPKSARGAEAAAADTAPNPINYAFKAVMEDIEHEAAVQHDELRRRLAADGNGAAADALRVQAAGFEEACDFKEESVDVVAERIFEVLSANSMAHALPLSFAAIPDRMMAELEECLEEAVWGTQVFTRRWGVDALDLLARTPEWTQRNCSRWNDTEVYVQVGRTLNLSKEQRFLLLSARDYLVDKYDKLYEKRQQLNEQLFGLLQPPPPDNPEYQDELCECLESLRENLAEEQRAISETEFVCWKQILNPVQGSWAILKAMPEHCDVMAMLNAVAEVYG